MAGFVVGRLSFFLRYDHRSFDAFEHPNQGPMNWKEDPELMKKAMSSDKMAARYSKLQWERLARIAICTLIALAVVGALRWAVIVTVGISNWPLRLDSHYEKVFRPVQKSVAYPVNWVGTDTLCLSGS